MVESFAEFLTNEKAANHFLLIGRDLPKKIPNKLTPQLAPYPSSKNTDSELEILDEG